LLIELIYRIGPLTPFANLARHLDTVLIVRKYVVYVFLTIQKTRFFEVSCQKNAKNVESIVQVFTFLHFETANKHFHYKTITHISCYTYNIILKLFIFGCNTMALLYIVRKTTKLIEGGHRGLLDYMHTCYYFYVFYVFTFFCRVSYVFSNYDQGRINHLVGPTHCTTPGPHW